MPTTDIFLALDIGSKRIGCALARGDVRLANPLTTVERTEQVMADLLAIIKQEQVTHLVAGLPRGLAGQTTAQTVSSQTFAGQLGQAAGLPVVLQDEALTSVKAEAELARRGKPYAKGDVDALAATYILEDYLQETAHV